VLYIVYFPTHRKYLQVVPEGMETGGDPEHCRPHLPVGHHFRMVDMALLTSNFLTRYQFFIHALDGGLPDTPS
jgi:hypothetical protein